MKVKNIVFSGAMASILMMSAAVAEDSIKDTDVTFAGKFSKATDTEETGMTGNVSNPVAEPEKSDYTYTNPDGAEATLETEGTDAIVQADYTGTSVGTTEPDGHGISVKSTELVSGMEMDPSNYQYTFDDETYPLTLDEGGNPVANILHTETVSLLDGEHSDAITVTQESVDAINGSAEFDATMYVITDDNGLEYTLYQEGDGDVLLVKKGTHEAQEPQGNLAELFDEAKGLYATDTGLVAQAKENTANQAAEELAQAQYALDNYYTPDTATLETLNDNYQSLANARTNFANDEADFGSSNAALDVYNAPILKTIEDGANEAITVALDENGAIKTAIDEGDTITLASAKSYADEGDASTLASANSYADLKIAGEAETRADEDAKLRSAIDANRNDIAALDSKVNDLDENLSAGIASSVALSAVEVSNVKKGEMSVGGGYGNYNSKSAMAFGAALGITDNWSANAGVGFGFGKDTKASFRIGTNYKFKLF